MGKYRHWWRQQVVEMIKHYNNLKDEKSEMTDAYYDAISKVIAYYREQGDHGRDVLRAVELCYIKNTHKAYGAADVLHAHPNTVKNWLSEFVYKVADEVGFCAKMPKK